MLLWAAADLFFLCDSETSDGRLCVGNKALVDEMDVSTKYFLRRMAMARRKNVADDAITFRGALFEVALIFFLAPTAALLSTVGMIALNRSWDPFVSLRWPWLSFKLTGIVIVLLALAFGHWWFRRKFRRYRHDRQSLLEFDTEQDRNAATELKIKVLVVCGLIVPWLAFGIVKLCELF